MEGKDFKLSDYQGKYVLIDFWKIERYLDKATTDERKALYSRVANDEKFVRFSMNLDPNHSAPALTKVQQENYYWTQVVLDKSQIETINKTFALEFTPGLILIDPNGNLIIKSHSNKVWWTVGQLIP